MPTLFSYCITHDYGSAPNPFGGICTLNICKPVIRRTAKEGDWIVATGSSQYGFGSMVVYAMEVTQVMAMKEYAEHCKKHLTIKIPNGNSIMEMVGDCIYDFSVDPPKISEISVHTVANRSTDLRGENTLLSSNFYYFGSEPRLLPTYPSNLLKVVNQGRGHKSTSNQPYFDEFVEWIEKQVDAKNPEMPKPFGHLLITEEDFLKKCSSCDKADDEADEEKVKEKN